MSGNYIKLYRSFLEWEWWHDANTSRVFLYILLMANWTDKKWKGTIIKRGSFVSSLSKIALATSLTVDQVRTAVKHLRDTEVITTESTPKNTVFTVVCYDKYQGFTEANPEQNTKQNTEQIPNNSPLKSQQHKNIKNIKNNKYIYSAAVIPHLNEKAGTRFREDSDSTERLLSARANEGFTVEDMIKVVDKKCEEWIGTEFEKYLRPKTLFNASHFEEYLNQKNNSAKKKPETKNKFNNFHQREHDWDELEKWALTTKPLVMPRRDNEQSSKI